MSPLFHFVNGETGETFEDLIQTIESLSRIWENPTFKLDRVIFSNLSSARQFLEQMIGTGWYDRIQREKKQNGFQCQSGCGHSADEPKFVNTLDPIEPPLIVTGLESLYGITPLLNILHSEDTRLKMEILTSDVPTSLHELGLYLQDSLHELHLTASPRFSEVCSQYEIDFTTNKKRPKKRTRRPSAAFQKILKKYGKTHFPPIMGNQYYGREVFNSFLSLYSSQIDRMKAAEENDIVNSYERSQKLSDVHPQSPMKVYDLAEEGWCEFRFTGSIPPELLARWLANLREVLEKTGGGLEMLRISCLHDAWVSEENYKRAGSDNFYLTINDVELAYLQQNGEFCSEYVKIHKEAEQPKHQYATYFQLTPPIGEPDFRINLIKKILKLENMIMR